MLKLLGSDRLLATVLWICLAGCAGISDSVRQLPGAAEIELGDVPFYAQQRYQCGPAALTTILAASGADVTLDEVVGKVYIPGRKGSLQLEMLAATRTSGRLPYVIDGTLAAILAELNAGRPVVVLQNLGVAALPRWHYAVAIGIDTQRDRVILRSGTERRRETPTRLFLRTWARSNFWGFVALRPGEMPATADRQRYFAATAGLETAGRVAEAALAWQAALGRWPDDPTALFGLGNTQLSRGDLTGAERAYRQVIAVNPALAVARNNLALTLARQSRFAEALSEIEQARALNQDAALDRILLDTQTEILSMADGADPR
jgi:tetratricopeptide (TPR) repeat protein